MRIPVLVALVVASLSVAAAGCSNRPASTSSSSATAAPVLEVTAAPIAPAAAGGGGSEAADGADDAAADSSDRADGAEAEMFHGYACTMDCSGHEAGYNWAEEHGITDPDDCPIDPHHSHSFTEGCWAFAGREGP
jgi:hypothetical protein